MGRSRTDRFGLPVKPGSTLAAQWGWRVRRCGGCLQTVLVFEIPAGYLDDPEWGRYRCGDCGGQTPPKSGSV